ncbi:MAG TPA: FmdB family zinc ribbon protein [Actinomycetes bacterium]|jgi:putative FmdB family regulatory protein|nr:FmdB family zinc ribbon protein [Actinomycetota bacterium]HEV3504375.1 FmdB family zinc ribbon protein [Actinomycetes bacterium]HEX2156306.1 FmdB family zinc ribbon protein [Actinomycetes bacterium]
MPTYEYACTECGDRTEVVQSISEAPLTTCTVCGGTLRKVFSPVGIVFKGSGFYRTDSRAKPASSKTDGGGDKDKAKKPSDSSSKSSSSDGGSSTAKTAEKSA